MVSLFIVAPVICGGSVLSLCFAMHGLISVLSIFVITLIREIESCFVTVSVLFLFLTVPLIGMWCVIVVFSTHTFFYFRLRFLLR